MVEQKIIEEFVEQIKPADKEQNKTHSAIVSKIDEEGTVWVRVAGSEKDTPTALVGTEVKKGDAVNVEWRNNKLYIANNFSNPSAGVVRIKAVEQAAQLTNEAANNAVLDAGRAKETADSASAAAEQAQKDAGSAKESAESAGEYAARALGNLSTVQSVTETLNWITQHGTMTRTTDTALDPTHVYFVQDNNGDYVVGNVRYSVVTEPKLADISTYYELSINESLNNYVATHLVLTDEGLYVLGGANQWKVLIATDGVYIIDGTSGVDKVVAKYKDIITLGIDDGSESYQKLDYHSLQLVDKEGYIYFHVSDLRDEHGIFNATDIFLGNGNDRIFTLSFAPVNLEWIVSVNGTVQTSGFTKSGQSVRFDNAPANGAQIVIKYVSDDMNAKAYTFGIRDNSAPVGGLSVAEGVGGNASGSFSHVEGRACVASARCSHAEGEISRAFGYASHAEGYDVFAIGGYSHAQNEGTRAGYRAQTAIGKYNDNKSDTALEIGNGTSDTARSNSHEVTWDGDVRFALDTSATSGTDKEIYDALVALGWASDVIS